MKNIKIRPIVNSCLAIAAPVMLGASLAWGVTPNARTFTAGQQTKVQGVIISRDGETLKLRADDDSIGTIDLTNTTKIQLKSGVFRHKSGMSVDSLVPGLHVEAQGKGNDKGELIADKVTFDPNSMRASRQIDTRVSPLESRTGTLEGRAGTLESRANQLDTRAGQIEGRQGQLEDQEHQLGTQVGAVKTDADKANQGVTAVNGRVGDIDNYDVKDTATVYFKLNSSVLSPEAKKDLDDLAQKAQTQKGYMLDVEGFADTTGKAPRNQVLSEARASAVIHYLEEEANIPVRRILAPTGMGTSHAVADNTTSSGRKQNRRVEVKILVSQGLVGGATASATAPADASTKPDSSAH
jgi:outer membrane protein OmpA-like peptidoglycan-associated protein